MTSGSGSATPTHEQIVPRELFEMVEELARRNKVRPSGRAHAPYPARGSTSGSFVSASGSGPLRPMQSTDGGQLPTRLELVSLPIRLEPRQGRSPTPPATRARSENKEETVLQEVIDFMGRRILNDDIYARPSQSAPHFAKPAG